MAKGAGKGCGAADKALAVAKKKMKATLAATKVHAKPAMSDACQKYANDLKHALDKKSKLDVDLRNVERQIFDLESRYLEDSSSQGNAIKGYKGFLTHSAYSSRKMTLRSEDRLFSSSSLSSSVGWSHPARP